MAFEITIQGRTRKVELRREGAGYTVLVDGVLHHVEASRPEPGVLHLVCGGESFEVDVLRTKEGQEITLYGTRYSATVLDERQKALLSLAQGAGKGGAQAISTSMPGKVVTVLVEVGAIVEAGQGVVVVEAMKMENELRATGRARVEAILVSAGQSVEGGAKLVLLAAAD
jgi:biotin carboxyl carrier protein